MTCCDYRCRAAWINTWTYRQALRNLNMTRKDLVLPSGDTLFTSGTLGHYSAMLADLQENDSRKLPMLDQTAAD